MQIVDSKEEMLPGPSIISMVLADKATPKMPVQYLLAATSRELTLPSADIVQAGNLASQWRTFCTCPQIPVLYQRCSNDHTHDSSTRVIVALTGRNKLPQGTSTDKH